jgi:ligand-binding SRPBCC domain-containing protein
VHHHFQTEQWLPYPVPRVFAFFANPDNLPKLMPAWQQARIEEASFAAPPPRPDGKPPAGVAAGAGTTMTLSFKPFPFAPFRVPWDATIDEFAWDDHFCDTQGRGPFAFWHHCHSVKPEERNGVAGTLLIDRLEYELPLGVLGEIGRWLFVEAQVRSIFAYRQEQTSELLKVAG